MPQLNKHGIGNNSRSTNKSLKNAIFIQQNEPTQNYGIWIKDDNVGKNVIEVDSMNGYESFTERINPYGSTIITNHSRSPYIHSIKIVDLFKNSEETFVVMTTIDNDFGQGGTSRYALVELHEYDINRKTFEFLDSFSVNFSTQGYTNNGHYNYSQIDNRIYFSKSYYDLNENKFVTTEGNGYLNNSSQTFFYKNKIYFIASNGLVLINMEDNTNTLVTQFNVNAGSVSVAFIEDNMYCFYIYNNKYYALKIDLTSYTVTNLPIPRGGDKANSTFGSNFNRRQLLVKENKIFFYNNYYFNVEDNKYYPFLNKINGKHVLFGDILYSIDGETDPLTKSIYINKIDDKNMDCVTDIIAMPITNNDKIGNKIIVEDNVYFITYYISSTIVTAQGTLSGYIYHLNKYNLTTRVTEIIYGKHTTWCNPYISYDYDGGKIYITQLNEVVAGAITPYIISVDTLTKQTKLFANNGTLFEGETINPNDGNITFHNENLIMMRRNSGTFTIFDLSVSMKSTKVFEDSYIITPPSVPSTAYTRCVKIGTMIYFIGLQKSKLYYCRYNLSTNKLEHAYKDVDIKLSENFNCNNIIILNDKAYLYSEINRLYHNLTATSSLTRYTICVDLVNNGDYEIFQHNISFINSRLNSRYDNQGRYNNQAEPCAELNCLCSYKIHNEKIYKNGDVIVAKVAPPHSHFKIPIDKDLKLFFKISDVYYVKDNKLRRPEVYLNKGKGWKKYDKRMDI